MKKRFKKIFLISVFFAMLLLLNQAVFAGAPAGHPLSLEPELNFILKNRLHELGYIDSDNDELLTSHISSFLRDNTEFFKEEMFNHNNFKNHYVDAAVCLMWKKGYREFSEYAFRIEHFCKNMWSSNKK